MHKHFQHSLLVLASVLACSPTSAATSSFESGAEGWRAVGDLEGQISWLATGGNPGGHVSVVDNAAGGVIYWQAPAAFLGDKSSAFGTNLLFDLQQVYGSGTTQFFDEDVKLTGAGLTLIFDTAQDPANGAWTSYAVPLHASGWRLDSLSGAPATDAQMLAVLGSLDRLEIRAEFRSGDDIGKLDNVSIVPEPATLLSLGLGLLAVLSRSRGRAPKAVRGSPQT